MANHKTGAQRHNERQDKIWDKAQNAKSKALEGKKEGAGKEHLESLQKKHGYSKEGTERYKKFFNMK